MQTLCAVDFQGTYSQDAAAYDDPSYGYDDGEEEEEITQEDCWTVISAFFDQKGLVRQQLDSFDEFVQNTMQELVDENADLILDQADQHTGTSADMTRRYEIKFGQIYLSRPTVTEADGSVVPVFPQEARLRNLTYNAPLYIEMRKRTLLGREDPDGAAGDIVWREEPGDAAEDSRKVWIGKVCRGLPWYQPAALTYYRFRSCCGRHSASSIRFQKKTFLT
jgi:DNA-directed RNA polymerase II subunit RPB2